MSVYEFEEYKTFLKGEILKHPNKGRGVAGKLAKHLSVHPTMVSQVLNGPKHFSQEQGYRVCDYFALGSEETRFFMNLLSLDKAGTPDLRNFYLELLDEQRQEASKVAGRFKQATTLSEQDAAIYYSDWKFSAVRLVCSLPEIKNRQDISQYLGISKKESSRIVDQLVKLNLLFESQDGLEIGSKITFLPATSPFLSQHHNNWRVKSIEERSPEKSDEMFLTSPLTCSRKTFEKIHLRLLDFLQEIKDEVSESESEELACLNIDFFKLRSFNQE